MTYGEFINGLSKAGVALDRKMLADLAVSDAVAFAGLVQAARAASGRSQ
jgi:large subunit ribosomal protein L20